MQYSVVDQNKFMRSSCFKTLASKAAAKYSCDNGAKKSVIFSMKSLNAKTRKCNCMSLFMYSAQHGAYASTQQYLGSIRKCAVCETSQPKEDFKFFEGTEQCFECIAEAKFRQLEVNEEN